MNENDEGQARGPDYLWDPSAAPDAEIADLERALAPHRWRGELPELPARVGSAGARSRPLLRLGRLAAAGVLLVAAAGLLLFAGRADGAPRYAYEVLRGAPAVEGARGGRVGEGGRIVCGADDAVRLAVADLGSVELGPRSRLRVRHPDEATEGAEHLLELERGTLRASIFAAPRLFQLGTPAGIAVDLGCVYSATVDEGGATRLAVDAGFVSFEAAERRVLVPAGASCRAWPGRGPGTPSWDTKDDAWRAAVDVLDGAADEPGAPGTGESLARVLATGDPADSLTLWHLVAHAGGEVRSRALGRLAELAPPPETVSLAACRAGDRGALEAWRATLGWGW